MLSSGVGAGRGLWGPGPATRVEHAPVASRSRSGLGSRRRSASLRLRRLRAARLPGPSLVREMGRIHRIATPSSLFRERRLRMSGSLLAGLEIAAVVSAIVTAGFAVAVRGLWRRGKSLREP